jgi:GNAT superfamily N-acetyltransferase
MTEAGLPVHFRSATAADSDAVLAVIMTARKTAMPWLPVVHTPAEDRWWVEHRLIAETQVTVADVAGQIVGICAMQGDMVEQLYITPDWQGRGIGRRFLDRAKTHSPDGLRLYCFRDNERAAGFYRAQGFRVIAEGDGSGNEEGMPDLLFAWSRETDAAGNQAEQDPTG